MTSAFTESIVEDAALGWLMALGYEIKNGPTIAAGEPGAERRDLGYRDVVLERRLRDKLLSKLISGQLRVTTAANLLQRVRNERYVERYF
jgi:hypothetical protein